LRTGPLVFVQLLIVGPFVRNPERAVKSVLLAPIAMNVAVLFRRRLRQLILSRYPSLDRFYLETDFSKGHVSEILRGKGSPSVATLIKLADALDLELLDFFIFPEDNERDKVIDLVKNARSDTIRDIVDKLSHPD
jgi:transcriptional regulator with XRE-family HTH domain